MRDALESARAIDGGDRAVHRAVVANLEVLKPIVMLPMTLDMPDEGAR
jgi:hypothetical protein